jgi:CheY-like chemotaxis protein
LHGVLKVASPGRVFGPEDLHLMAALAGVLAAVMDHAKRHGETRRNLEVLKFLLNLAPVGMVALDGDGRVLAANDVAYRWLGAESAAGLAERLAPETLGTDWRAATAFHFQADGKLIYAEARAHGAETGEGAARVYGLVLADLGAEQMRLADGLQRELYRGRWLGRPVALVVAETDNVAGGVLAGLPALREALREGETAGPLNALQLGLVIAGADEAGALGRLRELREKLPAAGLRLGLAAGAGADAATVIAGARAALKPAESVLRRTLLLHDDYPAVNDMLEMVLGRRFHIVKSTHIAETEELLRTRTFDGIFTEIELRNGASGIELARLAKRLQPGIRPYFTTVAHTERLAGLDADLADHVVLRKPFDLVRLDEAVRATLV